LILVGRCVCTALFARQIGVMFVDLDASARAISMLSRSSMLADRSADARHDRHGDPDDLA